LVNWKHRWLERRHFGLADAPRAGRPPEADAYMSATWFESWCETADSIAFTRWTAPRLAEYMGEQTDVWLTPEWIRELLRMQVSFWRQTKRTIRNLQNRHRHETTQKALRRLKKGL